MNLSQTDVIYLLIDIMVNAVIVFILVKILPGIDIKNFGSAIAVVIAYAILNTIVTYAFSFFGLEEVNRIVSQGLFQIVFNAILLLVINKVIEGFSVKNFWYALLGSFVFALIRSLVHQFFKF